MEMFLERHEEYEPILKAGGSGKQIMDLYRKAKWATQMVEKVNIRWETEVQLLDHDSDRLSFRPRNCRSL